ncbi:MAG: hypothetical protein A2X86_12860 [Bdellovibrionales bacterium GWA2_49_15]|nr:MAG: hypothetical protein A2X86_12860 [Bdellovibrionales bacterium GWA2_49_15]HAZ13875.1 hypothetical protein [Bdellovibrionales bacterium]
MEKVILAVLMMFSSTFAFGHASHAPKVVTCAASGCTRDQVEQAIPAVVEMMAQKSTVEASWTSAKIEKVELKQFPKGPEWVTTLFDIKQKDKAKQRLYIFITPKGYLNGANYTGN